MYLLESVYICVTFDQISRTEGRSKCMKCQQIKEMPELRGANQAMNGEVYDVERTPMNEYN